MPTLRVFWILSPVTAAILLWELISRSSVVSHALVPPPTRVITALWEMAQNGTLTSDLTSSLWRLLVGLAVGVLLGISTGLLTGRISLISSMLSPLIQILRPLPPVALIPLFIIWFGIGDSAKIIAIAFAVFFPVWINTHIGAETIPETYLWSAKLLSKSKLETVRKVMIPSALPLIFRGVIFPASLPFVIAGIRIGIAFAFIMVFVSELAGASQGLGYRISVAHLAYRIDEMIAALIVLGALGALTDQCFVAGTKKLFPWLKFNER